MTGGWWLKAGERVYGPYAQARLPQFLQEGRLAATSLLGRSAEGPFMPATAWPELTPMFAEPAGEDPFVDPHPDPSGPAEARPLLVLAALRETSADGLEQALLAHGPAERVRGTLWLCRARMGASALRNALSRRLSPAEFLLVAEADLAHAAWFNLDGETDRALRKLWSGPR